MFHKTKPTQVDLFKDISAHYSDRKQKLLDDPTGWHNVFYQQVYRNIEEAIFKPLYCLDNGRSNSSVKVLLAMMILKEGFGWSDKQLFEQCSFNILVMAALGFRNADQDIPAESTYYKFRSAFLSYKENPN